MLTDVLILRFVDWLQARLGGDGGWQLQYEAALQKAQSSSLPLNSDDEHLSEFETFSKALLGLYVFLAALLAVAIALLHGPGVAQKAISVTLGQAVALCLWQALRHSTSRVKPARGDLPQRVVFGFPPWGNLVALLLLSAGFFLAVI